MQIKGSIIVVVALVSLLLLLSLSLSFSEEFYIWKDEKGVQHIETGRPASEKKTNVQVYRFEKEGLKASDAAAEGQYTETPKDSRQEVTEDEKSLQTKKQQEEQEASDRRK